MVDVVDILILDMDADEFILWVLDPGCTIMIIGDLRLVNQLD